MKKKCFFVFSIFLFLLASLVSYAVQDSDQDGVPDCDGTNVNKCDLCPGSETTRVDQKGCSCSQKTENDCTGKYAGAKCCHIENNPCLYYCELVNLIPTCKISNAPLGTHCTTSDGLSGYCRRGGCFIDYGTADTFPPPPTGLNAVVHDLPNSIRIVDLYWESFDPRHPDLDNFFIYRSINDGPFLSISKTFHNIEKSYRDTISKNSKYTYYVTAVTPYHLESGPSNYATVYPEDNGNPPPCSPANPCQDLTKACVNNVCGSCTDSSQCRGGRTCQTGQCLPPDENHNPTLSLDKTSIHNGEMVTVTVSNGKPGDSLTFTVKDLSTNTLKFDKIPATRPIGSNGNWITPVYAHDWEVGNYELTAFEDTARSNTVAFTILPSLNSPLLQVSPQSLPNGKPITVSVSNADRDSSIILYVNNVKLKDPIGRTDNHGAWSINKVINGYTPGIYSLQVTVGGAESNTVKVHIQ